MSDKTLHKEDTSLIPYLSSNLAFMLVLQAFIITVSVFGGYQWAKSQFDTQQTKIITHNLAITPTPTEMPPTVTPTAIPSPTPTFIPTAMPSKIALHIDSIDYSNGHPAGLVTTNVKVQLFKMDGTLIEEKTPSPYVQEGEIGKGGDTVFYVLPSTYKVVSDTGSTGGTCIVTVRSTTEYNSCAIYMVKK